jgi:hypothetical protein
MARPDRKRDRQTAAASRPPERGAGFIAVLAVVSITLFAPVLGHRFTVDSAAIVQADRRVRDFDLRALLTTEYWNAKEGVENLEARPGLYRPLTLLWLSALVQLTPEAQLRAATSVPINAGNILLHAAGVVLRFLLFRRLLGERRHAVWWAFIGALAVAVHPISSEAVATQVGASDGLATLLSSASLLAFLSWLQDGSRRMLAIHVATLLLGLLAKESAIAVVPIAAALAHLHARRGVVASLRCALPAALTACAWMAWRLVLFGTPTGVSEPVFAGFTATTRIASALAVLVAYDMPALLWPMRLLPLVSFQDVLPAAGFADPRALAGLALVACWASALAWSWRRDRAAAGGLLIFAMALLPVSNLVFSIGALAATRFLYLPLTGLGLVLAAIASHAFGSSRAGVRALAAVVIAFVIGGGAAFTVREIAAWRDDLSIHGAAWERAPSSWSALSFGVDLEKAGRPDEALRTYLAGAAFERPTIPGRDTVPEDLLDASFQCAMNAAALQGTWARDMEAARRSLHVAVDVASRGLAQSQGGFGVTDWRTGEASALVELAQADVQVATSAGDGAARDAALTSARASLATARGLAPEDLLRERLELALTPPADPAEALARLRARARERLADDPYAVELVLEESRALREAGHPRDALRLAVEAASGGRRFVLDPAVLHDVGMEAARDDDRALREQGRDLLREFLTRMAASPRDPRVREVESVLSHP